MVQRTKDSILKRIEEEFVRTTDTLWENEIQANLFVARVLLGSALIDIIFIILATSDVLMVDKESTMVVLYQTLVELLVPALICLKLKGEKKWLKIVMLIEYTIVLARVESVLMHNVVLLIVFPVVLSIRYYSRPVTSFTAILTMLLSGSTSLSDAIRMTSLQGRSSPSNWKEIIHCFIKIQSYEEIKEFDAVSSHVAGFQRECHIVFPKRQPRRRNRTNH